MEKSVSIRAAGGKESKSGDIYRGREVMKGAGFLGRMTFNPKKSYIPSVIFRNTKGLLNSYQIERSPDGKSITGGL